MPLPSVSTLVLTSPHHPSLACSNTASNTSSPTTTSSPSSSTTTTSSATSSSSYLLLLPGKKRVTFAKNLLHIKYFHTEEPPMKISYPGHLLAPSPSLFSSSTSPSSPSSPFSSSMSPFSSSSSSYTSPFAGSSIRSSACRFRPHAEIASRCGEGQVCLETLSLRAPFLEGKVAVRNLGFEKRVTVRYSLDGWASFHELDARYSSSDLADGLDHFLFDLDATSLLLPSSPPVKEGEGGEGRGAAQLQFCIRYQCGGREFWDNNRGENYRVDFLRAAPPC